MKKGRWRRQEMTSGRLKTAIRGRKWVVERQKMGGGEQKLEWAAENEWRGVRTGRHQYLSCTVIVSRLLSVVL